RIGLLADPAHRAHAVGPHLAPTAKSDRVGTARTRVIVSLAGTGRGFAHPTYSARASSIDGLNRIVRVALTLGGEALRPAHDGDQLAGIEQALGDPPHVVDGDGVDHGAAPRDIVDAEIVELDLHQLAGDLGRSIEAEPAGPLDIGLRLRQLRLGRTGIGEPLDLLRDDLDGIAGALGARAGTAHQHRRMVEPDQLAVDRIGKPALL